MGENEEETYQEYMGLILITKASATKSHTAFENGTGKG